MSISQLLLLPRKETDKFLLKIKEKIANLLEKGQTLPHYYNHYHYQLLFSKSCFMAEENLNKNIFDKYSIITTLPHFEISKLTEETTIFPFCSLALMYKQKLGFLIVT